MQRLSLSLGILIWGTTLISVMGVSSLLPVLPELGREFGLTDTELGLVFISFTLPGVVLAPLGGVLADRLGRRAVLGPCLVIFALGGCAAGLSGSLAAFLFWRAVQGCGAACLGVLYSSIIADVSPDASSRLTRMGYAAMTVSLGTALYPVLGGVLGEWGPRQPLFLSLLALPLAEVCRRSSLPPPHRREQLRVYLGRAFQTAQRPQVLGLFFMTLCVFCIVYGPMSTYFPLVVQERFSATSSRIGIIFGLSSLGTALAASQAGWLGKRFCPRALILSGGGCYLAAMLGMLPCCALGWIGYSMLPVVLFGMGQGLVYPTVLSSLSGQCAEGERGIIMAVNGMALRLAQTLAPALGGVFFWLGGFRGVFCLLGTAAALAVLWTGQRLFPSRKRHEDHL